MTSRPTSWHLAQLNVARLTHPIDSPELADFVAALDPVNEVADAAPGFVWRLQDESGDATSIRPFGDDIIVNLSVWESVEALAAFMYGDAHADVLRRRREWFDPFGAPAVVAWWIPAGHRPTADEAKERLESLTNHGPSAEAFTLRSPYASP
jgi:Domain of unknown function (DUF3291)